jgi:hypothetical protein
MLNLPARMTRSEASSRRKRSLMRADELKEFAERWPNWFTFEHGLAPDMLRKSFSVLVENEIIIPGWSSAASVEGWLSGVEAALAGDDQKEHWLQMLRGGEPIKWEWLSDSLDEWRRRNPGNYCGYVYQLPDSDRAYIDVSDDFMQSIPYLALEDDEVTRAERDRR